MQLDLQGFQELLNTVIWKRNMIVTHMELIETLEKEPGDNPGLMCLL